MQRRSPPRLVTVLKTLKLSPHMLRVTFGGENLTGFPENSETATIKLLLPHSGQDWENYLLSLEGVGEKPLKRTYTVLEYRIGENELDIDFALHSDSGPATNWARDAQPGDQIAIAGPGSLKRIDSSADWFLLAGDMSALPAITANIHYLPAEAVGYVLIEIMTNEDKRSFELPSGIELSWVINSNPQSDNRLLADEVKTVPWMSGTPSIWIAGESNTVRELRQFLVKDKSIDSRYRYTSGYWQIGYTEDTHQLVKRAEPMD